MKPVRIILLYMFFIMLSVINAYAAEVLVDDFDSLSPEWAFSYTGYATALEYTMTNGQLVATDVITSYTTTHPQETTVNSVVLLSQSFETQSGDFTLTADFSWDNLGDLAALPKLYFFLDDIGTYFGYNDAWIADVGSAYLRAGLHSNNYLENQLGLTGSAHIELTRVDGTLAYSWNDTILYTWYNDGSFDDIKIGFNFKDLYHSGYGIYTSFGVISLDQLSITNPYAAVPEPFSIVMLIMGLIGIKLNKKLRI